MASTLSQFIAPIPKRPVISVVIPAHNHEQWIARTIRSALKQSYPPFEVIVVDDDSNDETPEQVASIAARDSRVRYLRHAQRRGPQAACNTGLKNAQGDWLALLEVGDEWQPEKLNKQAALVESSPFLPGVIYSG